VGVQGRGERERENFMKEARERQKVIMLNDHFVTLFTEIYLTFCCTFNLPYSCDL